MFETATYPLVSHSWLHNYIQKFVRNLEFKSYHNIHFMLQIPSFDLHGKAEYKQGIIVIIYIRSKNNRNCFGFRSPYSEL